MAFCNWLDKFLPLTIIYKKNVFDSKSFSVSFSNITERIHYTFKILFLESKKNTWDHTWKNGFKYASMIYLIIWSLEDGLRTHEENWADNGWLLLSSYLHYLTYLYLNILDVALLRDRMSWIEQVKGVRCILEFGNSFFSDFNLKGLGFN